MNELFPRDPPTLAEQIAELRAEEAFRMKTWFVYCECDKASAQNADVRMIALRAAIATLEGLGK